MNRFTLITIGIVLILCMLGIWVYLFVYGTPKATQEVFTNLGFLSARVDDDTASSSNEMAEDTATLAISGARLEQLSTRPIAGAVFIDEGTIRYAERGTGHIYDIHLENGTEEQVSLTTFAQTSDAVFSDDGASVALMSFTGDDTAVHAGRIDEMGASLSTDTLPANAHDIAFADAEHVRFAVSDEDSTTGYVYDLAAHTAEKWFTVPLRQVGIIWEGPYVYTLPSADTVGYIYGVGENDSLKAVPLFGKDLTAFLIGGKLAISMAENGHYGSVIYDPQTGAAQKQAIPLIAEKCSRFMNDDTLWCAAPLTSGEDMLENWYKGTYHSHDFFWKTDLSRATAKISDDLTTLSGRELDITQVRSNAAGDALIFLEKNDRSLWIYRVAP